MRYDTLFKSLLQSSLSCLIMRLTGSPAVEQLNVEFPSVEKRVPDLVTRLEDGRILHVELQTANDVDMPLRMLRYWVLLADRFPLNRIDQMVLYADYPELSMAAQIKTDSLQYRYHIVNFRDLDAAELVASPLPAERMLAVLCRTPDVRKTIREVLASWGAASQKERASLQQALMIVSGLRKLLPVVQEEVQKMAFDIDELIAEYEQARRKQWEEKALQRGLQRGLQQGLQQGVRQGLEQGREQGLEQGVQKGLHQGEALLFRRQLERRFGPLSSSTEERIQTANPAQIEEWALRILDAKSLDEVFA